MVDTYTNTQLYAVCVLHYVLWFVCVYVLWVHEAIQSFTYITSYIIATYIDVYNM